MSGLVSTRGLRLARRPRQKAGGWWLAGIDEPVWMSRLVDTRWSMHARRCRLVDRAGIDERACCLGGWVAGTYKPVSTCQPVDAGLSTCRLVDVPRLVDSTSRDLKTAGI